MIIRFVPIGGRAGSLQSVSVHDDVLVINGVAYDLSVIPDGATLPDAAAAVGCDFLRGRVERINGELHVRIRLPHGPLPQPHSVLFPALVHVTQDGPIAIPGVDDD